MTRPWHWYKVCGACFLQFLPAGLEEGLLAWNSVGQCRDFMWFLIPSLSHVLWGEQTPSLSEVFCRSCIERAVLTCEPVCPTCRAPMTKDLQLLGPAKLLLVQQYCWKQIVLYSETLLKTGCSFWDDSWRCCGSIMHFSVRPNLVVRSLLNELHVRCVHPGCYWTGRWDERPVHSTHCLARELILMQAACLKWNTSQKSTDKCAHTQTVIVSTQLTMRGCFLRVIRSDTGCGCWSIHSKGC